MVVRDPASNARWTVEAELRRRGLATAAAAGRGRHARGGQARGARAHGAACCCPRRVLEEPHWSTPPIDGLAFPRWYVLVLPAAGTPSDDVAALMERMHAALI